MSMFGTKRPVDLPILCRYDASGPSTRLDDWIHPMRIEIGLSTAGPFYSQFVYQLGHELGHVMLNPRRSNLLMEAIATAVSYEALDRVSEQWKTKAPFDYVRVHADEFRKYRERAEQEALSHVPQQIQSALAARDWKIIDAYLANHAADFELSEGGLKSESARAWESLAAMLFRAERTNWSKLAQCAVPEVGTELNFRYERERGPCQYGSLK